jgi:hypothetical protein
MIDLSHLAEDHTFRVDAFMRVVLPLVATDETLDRVGRPVCVVTVFDGPDMMAKTQLTGSSPAPQTKRELAELLASLPEGAMLAWYA